LAEWPESGLVPAHSRDVLKALDLSVAGDVRYHLHDQMLDGDRPDEQFRFSPCELLQGGDARTGLSWRVISAFLLASPINLETMPVRSATPAPE
jgi:hypothetical protein